MWECGREPLKLEMNIWDGETLQWLSWRQNWGARIGPMRHAAGVLGKVEAMHATAHTYTGKRHKYMC